MICTVITGPTMPSVFQQIKQVTEQNLADLIELRLDHYVDLNTDTLKILRQIFSIPMIFTLRAKEQGGNYKHSEEERLQQIKELLKLEPEYFDIEFNVEKKIIEEISSQHPKVKLILSYHHFSETPENLDFIYHRMKQIPAFFYKIAVMPKNSLDTLRLLCWKKKLNADLNNRHLIAISMGFFGQISRILSKVIESPIVYTCLNENQKSAPGQLSAETLVNQYNYKTLNHKTEIYGLIGNPIDRSISDITHNHLIKTLSLNSVYIKIQLESTELEKFFEYAKILDFKGLSVTMPLKEHILKFVDVVDSKSQMVGAINTLFFENKKIVGFNTDGFGALNAIEETCLVKNKRLTILGAGGASKAIAHEALLRGGLVTIVNRNQEKAKAMSIHLGCQCFSLEDFQASYIDSYDILINCTPLALPISESQILQGVCIMDITTKPKETELLKIANDKKCQIVHGYKMFVEQAIGQFNIWLNKNLTTKETAPLKTKAEECLSE